MNKYSLSPNEIQLMDTIWNLEKPVTSVDLVPYTDNYKNGYLQNLLKSLEKKGLIRCINIIQYGRGFAKQYESTMSKEEYAAKTLLSLQISKQSVPKVSLALAKELSNDDCDEIIAELEEIINTFKNQG